VVQDLEKYKKISKILSNKLEKSFFRITNDRILDCHYISLIYNVDDDKLILYKIKVFFEQYVNMPQLYFEELLKSYDKQDLLKGIFDVLENQYVPLLG
jgi:transposase